MVYLTGNGRETQQVNREDLQSYKEQVGVEEHVVANNRKVEAIKDKYNIPKINNNVINSSANLIGWL